MSEIVYRPAVLDDAAEIHALLLRLAPEIPLLVDRLEREEALYAETRNCVRSGESWVAADGAGHIVGFLLAAPIERGRHYGENELLDLRYAGVAAEQRRQGVFAALLSQLLGRMLPVVTRVPPQNDSGAAARLTALGFRSEGEGMRWQPGG